MGTNTPNQDSDTSKQLPSSEDFEESSEQLKGMLELLEPLNFTEIKEINGLLDEMADKVKEYNSQDSKLSPEEIEDCSHFIAKNLTPEALETIKYTVILIIRSEDELYKHKIPLNYKIEIVFNSIVFVLSPMLEDPTYKLDFPSDNFTIIDIADQINTAVSEELGDEVEPRVIARASSGTLIGEGSRSLLSTYTSKTLNIASINPLEYLYVIYSNSKNSEKIVNDRYSLSKLAYSLVSSALDDYMGAVLASEGKLASRKSIIAHLRSASIKFSCELMELIQVMRLTILKEGTSEKYISTGPAFYNSKRTTITDKTPSDTDRIDSILTVCMNLVDGFIVLAIMNEPQILDKISESVLSQHLESQDKKIEAIDNQIAQYVNTLYSQLHYEALEDNHLDTNDQCTEAIDSLRKMLEIEEASDNDLALNFIYYKTCLVYDDFLYNTSKLLEKTNTSPLYSILSLDVKSNRIDFIYKQEVIDLLQTVNQLSNLKNFATKLYASDVNIQNYLITERHLS